MKNQRYKMDFMYLPAVLLITTFVVYPLIRGFYVSFFSWNGYSQNMKFIGFDNYLKLFSDKKFGIAFGNTLLYGFGSALLQNILGISFALLLNTKFRGRTVIRTILYLPVMISGLLMGYIMIFFLQFRKGIFNDILVLFGNEPLDWLRDASRAKILITLVNSWQFAGISMIIYLAGLQNISRMYYEAAMIDGATPWQQFINITIPLLIPAISSAVVLNLIGGLKLNDIIISLTGGGPSMKTHSISTYISYMYFTSEKAGYASAVGIFLFAFISLVSTFANRFFRKREVQY